jgi:hypothetical protein
MVLSLYRVLHKLTPEQRAEMIERHLAGESTRALGREYSVDPSNVGYIVKRHLQRLAAPSIERDASEWITAREAGRLLAVTQSTVNAKIKAGHLKAKRAAEIPVQQRADHAQLYLLRADIEALAERYGRRLFPMDGKTPSVEDCIYLAGLFDGEGSICLGRSSGKVGASYMLMLTLTNTCHDAVNWVCETFGGSVQYRVSRQPNSRDQSVWTINCTGAYQILQRIGPFLRIKHQQALLGIKFFERTVLYDGDRWKRLSDEERQWRAEQHLLMQVLNARGIP